MEDKDILTADNGDNFLCCVSSTGLFVCIMFLLLNES